ncbi:hypothetical protein RJ639_038624 [Escallonia herrerae]|uniref:Uncharacterized protein n=1 Tax=Escallonia herrerae TaxID=1293975 RepID=A0AA89BCR2_9ASTE|nr:hypothetical protein RJ639_038624 [Escallonia herrerae]
MALTGSRIPCNSHTRTTYTPLSPRRQIIFPSNPSWAVPLPSRTSLIVSAAKKLSSRTGKFDSKNRRSSTSTKEDERTAEIGNGVEERGSSGAVDAGEENYEGYVLPDLPGLEKDFWEGTEWDAFGFFVQYLWAFGIVFALISSGIAVATYNEGATDFKETPAYKESIQSRELLEEPEASNSDVFESNPTEEAPTLE